MQETQTTIPWKPSRQQVLAAEGKTVRDVIAAPSDGSFFAGINPGLYTLRWVITSRARETGFGPRFSGRALLIASSHPSTKRNC